MKTAIKTLFATTLTAIVLTSSAFTTFAQVKNPSVSSTVSDYNKIKVTGNVTVYLNQGTKQDVRIETDQPETKVLFKREGGKLTISTAENETATVYLTVKDLQRIEASGYSLVRSNGKVNFPLLQIFVQDDAKVDVNVTSQDLYTVVKGTSVLKLSGSTSRHTSIKDDASKLNTTNFAAAHVISSKPMFANVDLDAQFAESLNLASAISKGSK